MEGPPRRRRSRALAARPAAGTGSGVRGRVRTPRERTGPPSLTPQLLGNQVVQGSGPPTSSRAPQALSAAF